MTLMQSSFTFVIFQLLGLLDEGRTLDFENVRKAAEAGNLIEMLEQSFPFPSLDLSHIKGKDRQAANALLTDIALSVWGRERRKFAVKKNGMPLAIAYFLEAIQRTKP